MFDFRFNNRLWFLVNLFLHILMARGTEVGVDWVTGYRFTPSIRDVGLYAETGLFSRASKEASSEIDSEAKPGAPTRRLKRERKAKGIRNVFMLNLHNMDNKKDPMPLTLSR